MSAEGRVLPKPDAITQPFWDSVRAHAMRLQRCAGCARFVFYPRAFCPHCGGTDLVWTTVSGRGTVYAFAIPQRHTSPALAKSGPFVLALVELDEGVRMLTTIVEVTASPEHVRTGMAVEVVYEDVDAETTLPQFRPVAR